MSDETSETTNPNNPETEAVESTEGEAAAYVPEDPAEAAARQERRERASRIANRYELAVAFRDAIAIPDQGYRYDAISTLFDTAASADKEFQLLPAITDEESRKVYVKLAEEWFKSSSIRYGDIDVSSCADEQVERAMAYADIVTLGKQMSTPGGAFDATDFARRRFVGALSKMIQGGAEEDETEFGDPDDYTTAAEAIPITDSGDRVESDLGDTMGHTPASTAPAKGGAGWSNLVPSDSKGTGWTIPQGGPTTGWAIPSEDHGSWDKVVSRGTNSAPRNAGVAEANTPAATSGDK